MVCFIYILVYRYTIYMVYHKYVYFIHIYCIIQISIDFLFESMCMCAHMFMCVWISMQWRTEDNLRYSFQGRHICPLRTGLECTN